MKSQLTFSIAICLVQRLSQADSFHDSHHPSRLTLMNFMKARKLFQNCGRANKSISMVIKSLRKPFYKIFSSASGGTISPLDRMIGTGVSITLNLVLDTRFSPAICRISFNSTSLIEYRCIHAQQSIPGQVSDMPRC